MGRKSTQKLPPGGVRNIARIYASTAAAQQSVNTSFFERTTGGRRLHLIISPLRGRGGSAAPRSRTFLITPAKPTAAKKWGTDRREHQQQSKRQRAGWVAAAAAPVETSTLTLTTAATQSHFNFKRGGRGGTQQQQHSTAACFGRNNHCDMRNCPTIAAEKNCPTIAAEKRGCLRRNLVGLGFL